jgi:peptidyl-prolyl cis-trans isomerase D
MLKILRQGQRWVTGIFVIAIGLVFVFYLGIGGGGRRTSPGVVVEIGDRAYGIGDFQRVRAQREAMLQEQLGEQYDPRTFRDTLDQMAVQGLIESAILSQEATDLGFAVANSEIERFIKASPGFRDQAGKFDPAQFESWASFEFGNERNFIRNQRSSMLTNKLLRALSPLFIPSDGEAREAVIFRLEELQIAFAIVDPPAPEDYQPDPAALEAALTDRELEIRSLYGERSSLFNVSEQVRASHILVNVPADASEEQAEEIRANAQQILERARGGEDFTALAREFSEDPGSKDQGGNLGLFGRGQMVSEFEDAAFSREVGELGELVKSKVGFHILRIDEKLEPVSRSYEDVREELAAELLGAESARNQSRLVADRVVEAIRGGSSLQEAATAEGVVVTQSDRVRRRADGFVPGLGSATELMNTAYTMEAGQSSDRVFNVDGKLVLLQLVDRYPPDYTTIDGVIDQERDRLENQKRIDYITAWINQRRDQLLGDGELIVNLEALRGG